MLEGDDVRDIGGWVRDVARRNMQGVKRQFNSGCLTTKSSPWSKAICEAVATEVDAHFKYFLTGRLPLF